MVTDERITSADESADLEANGKTLLLHDTNLTKLRMEAWLTDFAISSNFEMITTDQEFSPV